MQIKFTILSEIPDFSVRNMSEIPDFIVCNMSGIPDFGFCKIELLHLPAEKKRPKNAIFLHFSQKSCTFAGVYFYNDIVALTQQIKIYG